MDLFEILIILLFILFPLIDGIRRGQQKKQGPALPKEPSRPPESSAPEWEEPATRGEPASVMVPDDLWEILTGERRGPAATPAPANADAPWEESPIEEEWIATEVGHHDEWRQEAEERAAEVPHYPEVVPLGYRDDQPISLERPLQSSEVRHLRFHEKLARDVPPPIRPTSRIVDAVRHPDSLRTAIILSEVLGPPRGLD